MTATCENCGAELHRTPGIFRDTSVCPACGWWCDITPGTGMVVAAAASAFLSGLFGAGLRRPDEDDLQPA